MITPLYVVHHAGGVYRVRSALPRVWQITPTLTIAKRDCYGPFDALETARRVDDRIKGARERMRRATLAYHAAVAAIHEEFGR